MLLEAPDFAFHAFGVATVPGTSKIASGDDPKRSHFGQGLEFRVAQEIGPVACVVGAGGIERLWHSLISRQTINGSGIVWSNLYLFHRARLDLRMRAEWAAQTATTFAALVLRIDGMEVTRHRAAPPGRLQAPAFQPDRLGIGGPGETACARCLSGKTCVPAEALRRTRSRRPRQMRRGVSAHTSESRHSCREP